VSPEISGGLTASGWVVALGLVLYIVKMRRIETVLADFRTEMAEGLKMNRHDMRDEVAPLMLHLGVLRGRFNELLALKHPELFKDLRVPEPEN
jgi:hypothetical protein